MEIQYVLLKCLTPRGAQALCVQEEESTDQEATCSNYIGFVILFEQTVNATGATGSV